MEIFIIFLFNSRLLFEILFKLDYHVDILYQFYFQYRGLNSMKNKKILVGLIAITLIAGVSTINAENIIDITINQQHEKTGLELGTNSYARGESSIATGKNSVAIGSGAVATGDNLTGEKIKGMLAENKSKLEEIDAKKNKIKNLSDDINNLKIREHDVIEAGIRVREIQKSKANAKNVWTQAEKDWQAKKDGSQAALNSYQEKIDDLNSRLTGVKNLKNSNISTLEGLTAAATELKAIVEKGTKMDLSVDFYKDYIDNYYKSLGDLREKNKIYSYIGWDNIKIKDLIKENFLKADMQDIVIQYNNFQDSNSYSSYSSSSASDSYSYGNCDNSSNSYSSSSSTASYYSSLGEYGKDRNGIYRVNGSRTQKQEYNGVKYQTDWNIKGDICDQVTFDKWNAVKEGWKAQIKDANKRSGSEIFGKFDTLTGGKSTILFNMVTEMKFELVDLDYQICHYQWQYERTRNNKWLDKKREALEKRQQKLNTNEQTIKNKYKELFHKDLSDTAKLFNTIGQDLKKEFKEKEIDSIEQKNKITTDKLTSDLERELGINKNAIQNYENEIKSLREKADQAKKNYEGLNPSVKDLILSREYESVAKELENKASQLKTETEALEELKKNLKLNDLKNIGENAIAYGTNALVTGKNSIGIGTNVLITGEDAIGIGRENIVSALGSVAIGTNNKILGNNTFVLGTNIVSNAENAVILGKDSVGENNTLSVGSTGNERKIIHVGNPTQNTDAVNLQYMKEYVSNIDVTNQISSKADKSDLNKKADKDAGNIEISKWQTKLGDGKNEAGNTGLVTGSTLNKALEGKADKTYVDGELNKKADKSDITNLTNSITNKANISLNNIDESGKTVIKNLAKGSIKVANGTNTTVSEEKEGDTKVYKVNVSNETIKNAIKSDLENKADKSDLDKKADKDAGNIEISKWQTKLGDGKNEAGNTGLVTGSTLNKALEGKADKTYVDGELNKKADKSDITNLTNSITNKANISLNNIDESGKTVIKNLAKGSIKVANGTNTTVSEEKEGDTKVYKVNVSNETIKNAIKSDLENKADKSDLDKKADKDAGNIEISKWQSKLGDGKNEAGNTGLVTGGTLNKALEDVKAGKVDLNGEISADNKTKGVTGDKIYYAISNMTNVLENRGQARYNVLDNKINETGAESAALSALKYDNEDSKLQLAAGVGHYNSKTAYALGLKYNMNNNASFHFGSTIGNGKTMLNGGFSIAIGSGHKKVNADAIKRMENMQNEIDELKRQNQELMKAIEKMGHVLNIDKTKKDSFKDIPKGHWAKEAVEVLHGNGIVEGYPDGEFKGDKPMTRYEYSQMLEKALAKA